ncbi:hypothetical protein KAR26_01445 [Candidatus Parcubacteria bacterium]|nr:hypothetical protein [Candidatus Parcubacteria bacterium]
MKEDRWQQLAFTVIVAFLLSTVGLSIYSNNLGENPLGAKRALEGTVVSTERFVEGSPEPYTEVTFKDGRVEIFVGTYDIFLGQKTTCIEYEIKAWGAGVSNLVKKATRIKEGAC